MEHNIPDETSGVLSRKEYLPLFMLLLMQSSIQLAFINTKTSFEKKLIYGHLIHSLHRSIADAGLCLCLR